MGYRGTRTAELSAASEKSSAQGRGGRRAAAERKAAEVAAAELNTEVETIEVISFSSEELSASTLREEEINNLILNHRENGRKLARSILRRWRVRMPAEEIDSIVDLSLCEAARRYSSERGASFMTFFFYHLRGHLVRAVARAAQATNTFLAFNKPQGIDAADWSNLGSDMTWSFVPDQVVTGQRDADTPENVMIRQEKIKQCQTACSQLDTLEREIIDRSFSSEQPLVDIARSLGYSRCHISRVKKSALDRLKKILNAAEQEKAETVVKPVEEPVATPLRGSVADRKIPGRRSRRRSISRVRGAVKQFGVRAA